MANVAVIGYGMSAQIFHIPFIQHSPHLTLHTIVQRTPPTTLDASRPFFRSAVLDHPDVVHRTSHAPALADPSVQVVVITTPPATHAEIARAAIEAGKHVLVEKPFCPTAAEARKLAALAREKGVVLCSYNNRRWDADFLHLRALVGDQTPRGTVGPLGRVVELNTHFDRFRPNVPIAKGWKTACSPSEAGGPLYDLGSHLIDQAYVLFGLPSSVWGKLTVSREVSPKPHENIEKADSVLAVLNYYPSGLTVIVRAGVLSAETVQPRFWARGTRGSWHKEGVDPQEAQLIAGKRPGDEDFGIDSIPGRLVLVDDKGELKEASAEEFGGEATTYTAFYEAFAQAVRGKGDVPVSADEAADVLMVIEAVLESAREGKEVPVYR